MISREDEIGYLACETFYRIKSDRVGRHVSHKDYFNSKYRTAFRKIARICMDNKLDVEDYISTCFDLLEREYSYIDPHYLASANAASKYLSYKTKTNKLSDVEMDWLSQISMLIDLSVRQIPSVYKNEAEILDNMQLPFALWFRLFYPNEISNQSLDLYGKEVWKDLKSNWALCAFLKKVRPDHVAKLEQRFGIIMAGG